MTNRNISPAYMYFFGLLVHLACLIAASLALRNQVFEQISESYQNGVVPAIILGILFVMALLLSLRYINRHIYFSLSNNHIHFGSLFRKGVVPIESVSNVKYIFNKMCKLTVEGKTYYFFGYKIDVMYMKNLLESKMLTR